MDEGSSPTPGAQLVELILFIRYTSIDKSNFLYNEMKNI